MPTSNSTATPASDATPRDDVRVTAITTTEWTVRNARVDAADARSLIGFIEHVGPRYEVMTFGDPMRFSRYKSFDDAVASFTRERTPRFPLITRRRHLRAVDDAG